MATIDEQLVRRITEQVIAQMKAGQIAAPVAVKPPAGTCTGDYSKFEDRAELAKAKRTEDAKPRAALTDVAPLTGFVTGRHVDAIKGTVLPLAFGAKLTPLGRDRAKERGLTIQRVSSKAGAGGKSTANAWHWWIAGHCPAVDQVTGDLKLSLMPLSAKREMSQLHRVVADLSKRVKTGNAAGAVLFVPTAARAICYANRCPSLRASVATCGEAVEQSIEQLAANVLVVEYPHHGPKAIRAMVERFITAARPSLPRVETQLKELASCV
jgi:ribose 5-phosphate isomerase RpiB